MRMLLVVMSGVWCASLHAMGLTLHIESVDRAMRYMPESKMRSLLRANKNKVRSGSIFPDTGYIIEAPYAEHSHGAEFINAYKDKIAKDCSENASIECRAHLAHWMGALAHVLGDVNFDAHFLTKARDKDGLETMSKTQGILDKGLDFVYCDHNPAVRSSIPDRFMPLDYVLGIYDAHNIETDIDEMTIGHQITWAMVIGTRGVATTMAKRTYRDAPWSIRNYLSAKGGLVDTSWLIADQWKIIADAFEKDGYASLKNMTFKRPGSWPRFRAWIEVDQ